MNKNRQIIGELQVYLCTIGQVDHSVSVLFNKNASLYANNGLGQLFSCKKDTFYRFMNNGRTLTARYKQKRGKTVTLIQDSQRRKNSIIHPAAQ